MSAFTVQSVTTRYIWREQTKGIDAMFISVDNLRTCNLVELKLKVHRYGTAMVIYSITKRKEKAEG